MRILISFAFAAFFAGCSYNKSKLNSWVEEGASGEIISNGCNYLDYEIGKLTGLKSLSDTVSVWSEGGIDANWFSIIIEDSKVDCDSLKSMTANVPNQIDNYVLSNYKVSEGWIHLRNDDGRPVCNFFLSWK